MSILLNSSKQAQAPCWANPLKSLFIIPAVIWSEQLKTMQSLPNPFAKSFVDSVLPVPAGPAGAAPSWLDKALVMVIQHLSVRGVITNLVVGPMYSYPYLKKEVTCLTMQSPPSPPSSSQ